MIITNKDKLIEALKANIEDYLREEAGKTIWNMFLEKKFAIDDLISYTVDGLIIIATNNDDEDVLPISNNMEVAMMIELYQTLRIE